MSMSFTRRSGPAPSSLAAALRTHLQAAQRANEQDLVAAAKQMVHVHSGQTQGSLEAVQAGPFTGRLMGRHGAAFEQARGGAHAFADRALAEAGPRTQDRVQAALEAATHGG